MPSKNAHSASCVSVCLSKEIVANSLKTDLMAAVTHPSSCAAKFVLLCLGIAFRTGFCHTQIVHPIPPCRLLIGPSYRQVLTQTLWQSDARFSTLLWLNYHYIDFKLFLRILQHPIIFCFVFYVGTTLFSTSWSHLMFLQDAVTETDLPITVMLIQCLTHFD